MKLDERTKELIAIGSSVSANCQPCLEYHASKARALGADHEQIAEAIAMGRIVRKGAASKMDHFAVAMSQETPAGTPVAGGSCGCDA